MRLIVIAAALACGAPDPHVCTEGQTRLFVGRLQECSANDWRDTVDVPAVDVSDPAPVDVITEQAPNGCRPGATAECFCAGQRRGVQACADDGASYGDCTCSAGEAPPDEPDEPEPPPVTEPEEPEEVPPEPSGCTCRETFAQDVSCAVGYVSCQGARTDSALCARVADGERSYLSAEASRIAASYPRTGATGDSWYSASGTCPPSPPDSGREEFETGLYQAGGCTCSGSVVCQSSRSYSMECLP